MGGKKGAYVFLKDPENAWIPAKLISQNAKTADVQIPEYPDEQSTICDGGKTAKRWIEAEVDLSDYNKGVLPMQNVDETGDMSVFPDMVELPFLHEVRTKEAKRSFVGSRIFLLEGVYPVVARPQYLPVFVRCCSR
jgi:hypothetical protein